MVSKKTNTKETKEEVQKWTVMEQIEHGVAIVEKMVKLLKKPADKKALEATKETLGVIKKQYKAMQKDEAIRIQYEDKVAYSTIQLMFQTFHLAILSDVDSKCTEDVIAHIKTADSVYTLAGRIKDAAEARADFGPVRKGQM